MSLKLVEEASRYFTATLEVLYGTEQNRCAWDEKLAVHSQYESSHNQYKLLIHSLASLLDGSVRYLPIFT